MNGDTVTYVVTRNINYTNVCYFRCGFCAFSKGKLAANLRGRAYLVPLDEIVRRCREAWERGAVEVCLQGGIHPSFTGDFYLDVCRAIKKRAPADPRPRLLRARGLAGAATLGSAWTVPRATARRACLAARHRGGDPGRRGQARHLPGQGLDGPVARGARAAHRAGLRSTTTIMFGHADTPRSWARHLLALREHQKRTGGFTEFVPLPFVHMEAPIYLHGQARPGPTFREAMLMHAVEPPRPSSRGHEHPGFLGEARVEGAQAALGPARTTSAARS